MDKQNSVTHRWEWPGKRKAQIKVVIDLQEITTPGKGLFNIKTSPSIASNLPDPIYIKGPVLASTSDRIAGSISLILPKLELPNTKKGNRVALGLVEGNICICAMIVSKDIETSQLETWLSKWSCGSE